MVALLALVLIAGYDLFRWLPDVPPAYRIYIGPRILRAIGTQTDLPALQVAGLGSALLLIGRRRAAAAARTAGPFDETAAPVFPSQPPPG